MIRATICEIIKDDKLLLQHKAAGKFGEGKWNGPGGKLKQGETPKEGVTREVLEETGLTIFDPILYGEIDFYFGENHEPDWHAYIYKVTNFRGELKPNDEGELRWFSLDEVPYSQMWQDDIFWLPSLFQGKKFRGFFIYDTDGEKLLKHELISE